MITNLVFYIQNIEEMRKCEQPELASSRVLLSDANSSQKTKQQLDDRFLLPNWYSRSKTSKKRHRSQSVDSYESYLSNTILQNDNNESIRNFTIQKTEQKKYKTNLGGKLKLLRNNHTLPFRKFKVLGWKDNYYTNLLDWAPNNFICAGYLSDLCLYNMAIDDQFQSSLYRKYSIGISGQYLTSLKCSPCQTKIALGYSSGAFKLYDYFKEKTIYNGYHHIQRIGTIQWQSDTILTGSKDQCLKLYDPRKKKAIEIPGQLQKSHTQQICGVRQKGRYISTGGNDNRVNICDVRKFQIVASYYHGAAVKAMSWISEKTLATGGGTADKKIKLWSEGKGVYKEIDTGSQVCSLCWSPSTNEIVSCQGFSLNQIIIWNRNGSRQFTFHGHTSRVLYSAMSPNGQSLASGAGDQYLKIWKLFPSKATEQTLLNQELR